MSISAAIPSRLRNNTDCLNALNPFRGRHGESIQASLTSNPVEFDGIKIGIVQALPQSQKLQSVAPAHPVFDDIVWIAAFELRNISQ